MADEYDAYWYIWVRCFYKYHADEEFVFGPFDTQREALTFSADRFRKLSPRCHASHAIAKKTVIISQKCPWY